MKLSLIVSNLFYLPVILLSCKERSTGSLNYHKLKYDTNRIAIFQWDTSKYVFPNNSDPLPLTQEDIFLIDSLLQAAIDTFNINFSQKLFHSFNSKVPLETFVVKREKYKYQFFPYKDVNGQRLVLVVGFLGEFQTWKNEFYMGQNHYGMNRLELTINLSEKTSDYLRTADFG